MRRSGNQIAQGHAGFSTVSRGRLSSQYSRSVSKPVEYVRPNMLNAAIRACPVFGGRVAGFDAAAVSGMPGVRRVVQVDDTAVAVVADTWWQAKTALDNLPVEWDEGPNSGVSSDSIAAMLAEGLDAEEASQLVEFTVDELTAETGEPPHVALARLLQLEMSGQIRRVGFARFARVTSRVLT